METSAERPTLNEFKGEEEAQKYHEKTNVNGTEISVGWDGAYDNFTIYFPQIEPGAEKGVPDQVIIISEKPGVAKQVFKYASEVAAEETNVYEIYRKVDVFVRKLSVH